jgi:hypothetical protein
VSDDIFSFLRFDKNSAPYLVAVNVGTATVERDFVAAAGVQVKYCVFRSTRLIRVFDCMS